MQFGAIGNPRWYQDSVILIARFDIHDKTTKTTTSTHCQGRCDCSMRQRTKFGKSLTSLNMTPHLPVLYVCKQCIVFANVVKIRVNVSCRNHLLVLEMPLFFVYANMLIH